MMTSIYKWLLMTSIYKWLYIYVGAIFEGIYRLGAAGFDLDKADEKLEEDLIQLRKAVWRKKQNG
jgi:hypothetical protein